jgi:UDP-glucose 4-epimerase
MTHGDASQIKGFVHIRDVVATNLRVATTDRVGEAYNIGRGEQTSIRTLADQIHQITESDSEILHMDLQPGDVDASVADILKSPRRTRI